MDITSHRTATCALQQGFNQFLHKIATETLYGRILHLVSVLILRLEQREVYFLVINEVIFYPEFTASRLRVVINVTALKNLISCLLSRLKNQLATISLSRLLLMTRKIIS